MSIKFINYYNIFKNMSFERMGWKLSIMMLILVAVILRLIGSQTVLFGDETLFAENVRSEEYVNYYAAHPPLSLWILTFWGSLFNHSIIAIRLITSFFSIVTIILTSLIARDYFSEKTSVLSALFLIFSPWFLVGSLQLDIVGSFLTCFYTFSLFFYLKFLDNNKLKYIVLSGIAAGFSLLTNYGAALLFPTIFLHYMYNLCKQHDFTYSTFLRICFIFVSSATIIFAIFPVWSFFVGSPTFINSVTHTFDLMMADPGSGLRPSEGTNLILLIIQYLNALVWIGPLLLFTLILSLLDSDKQNNRVKNIFLIQIIIVLIFFTFVIKDNFRPIEKYLLVLAPGLSILSANYLKKLFFKKKEILLLVILFLLTVLSFNILSVMSDQYIPFYPKQNYLSAALNLTWNVKVPLLGHAGPIGFYTSLNVILISFIASFIISVFYFIFRLEPVAKYLLIILLVIGLSYNVLFIQEILFSTTGPNIDAVTKNVISELQKNKYDEPIYFFRNVAFKYYLSDKYKNLTQIDFDDENRIKKINDLNNSTLAVINFPKINEESLLWKKIKECVVQKEFYDKGQRIGFISRC